jgi:secreted pullulanase
MKRAPRLLSLLAVAALSACGSCTTTPTSYPTPPADAPLGVAFDPASGAATFRVWAPAAGSAAVLFFADATSSTPTATHAMQRDLLGGGDVDGDGWNGVWEADVAGVADGQIYQYALDGRRVLDPYAPSMARFDSSTQQVGRGAVVDPAGIRPLDLGTPGEPEVEMLPFSVPDGYARREDAVIYEAHVRDFTIDLPAAGLAHDPGTYLAFAERLDYVKALGATHVQLLPVLAYYWGDESRRGTYESARTTRGNNYNWGYDPQGWFAPDGMYATDPADPRGRVRELRTLVNEAHKRGLGVILDVVYNHTADEAILDPLAPGYYYRETSSSGTGNDTASERKMMRKLIVDSVGFLAREYRVDGFRFDLMGLIDSKTILDAYAAAQASNPAILFVGEGWRMSGVPSKDDQGNPIVPANQDWMTSTDAAAVFSDSYRDVIKGGGMNETSDTNTGFLTLLDPGKDALFRNLKAQPTNFASDSPGDAVQYLTAHDGLTLHDKIGKILRLAPDSPAIPKVARLGFALQATSQEILFLHAGCELGRSKWVTGAMSEATPANAGTTYYVFNSYDASDAVNGVDWSLAAAGTEGARLHDYVQGLLALRRSTDAFRLGDEALVDARMTLLDGSRANAIAYRAVDAAGTTRYSVFVNAGTGSVTLASGDDLTAADVIVDGAQAGVTPILAPAGLLGRTATAVTLGARTALVFRAPLP